MKKIIIPVITFVIMCVTIIPVVFAPTVNLMWLPPLSNQDNIALKDGSTLPIKFSVTDSQGAFVIDTNAWVGISKIHFQDNFEAYTIGFPATNWQPNIDNWIIVNDGSQSYCQDSDNLYATSETKMDFNRTERGGIVMATNVKLIEGFSYKGRGIFWQSDSNNYVWFFYAGHTNKLGLNIVVDGTVIASHSTDYFVVSNDEWAGSDWHRMTISITGNTVRCLRDGQEVIMFEDSRIEDLPSIGKVHLFTYGAHAHFDDVMVRTKFFKIFTYGEGVDNLRISENSYIANLHTKELGLEPGEYMIMARTVDPATMGVYIFELTDDIQGIGRGKNKN